MCLILRPTLQEKGCTKRASEARLAAGAGCADSVAASRVDVPGWRSSGDKRRRVKMACYSTSSLWRRMKNATCRLLCHRRCPCDNMGRQQANQPTSEASPYMAPSRAEQDYNTAVNVLSQPGPLQLFLLFCSTVPRSVTPWLLH